MRKRQVGNFPQAFSHLGIINAARVLTLAGREVADGRIPNLYEAAPTQAARVQ